MSAGRITEFQHVPGTTVARLFNFDIAQDRIKPEHRTWLRKNVIGLLRNGGSLWIMGLTSTTGSEAFNRPLSQKRAGSVVAFLRGELSKDFPVKLAAGLGELAARTAGLRDNTEDANWRAVVLGVWGKPAPPPPPPPAPIQEACKRTVINAGYDGVHFFNFYPNTGNVLEGGDLTVKASPDLIKCATDFERKWSFLTFRGPRPVVLDSDHDPTGHVFGEVVGHYMTVSRYYILAETATLKRLPPPYNNSFLTLPLEALFNGFAATGRNNEDLIQLGFKVPLFVGDTDGGGYSRLAYSSEGAQSYTVVTDIYGKILLLVSEKSSRYPKRETTLHVVVSAAVHKTVKIIIKNLWRLL
jgi:hypothetical protein